MKFSMILRRMFLLFVIVTGVVYSQITLTLPTVSGIKGKDIQNAAVKISDVTGMNISSFQFQINYDPSVIYIYGTSVSGCITPSSTTNGPTILNSSPPLIDSTQGIIRISWAGTNPLSGSGTLLNLKLKIKGNSGATVISYAATGLYSSGATFTSMFGDGSNSVTGVNGSATVGTNIAPTLTLNPAGPTYNISEGSNLSIQLTGSDPDVGDVLSFSFSTNPTASGANFDSSTGIFSWTPATNQAGTYNVTFSVSDGKSTTSKNVTINVGKANIAPSLTLSPAGPYSVMEGNALSITLNGTDANIGDVLTYSYSSTPTMVGATLNASTKIFSWSTAVGQSGTYNVVFSVSDGQVTTNVSTTITVNSLNSPPTLSLSPSGPYGVDEGSTLSFSAVGADPNAGDVLTYSFTSTPTMTGATINSSTGAFSWKPASNQAGTYSVTFSVSDGKLTTSVTTSIIVNKVNQAPTLTLDPAGPYLVYEASTLKITLVGNDPNSGDVLTYSVTTPATLPAGAQLANNVFTWTPDYGMASLTPYNFTFKVRDQSGLSASVSIIIIVGHTNRAPVFTSVLPAGLICQVNKPTPTVFTFTYKATDPENDNLTYSLISGPSNASITTGGVFSWGPTENQVGQSFVVTVQVSDGSLTTQTSQIIYASNTITAIEDYSNIPSEYKLMQNYPNPFNPTTTINYSLPKEGFVRLVIYDLLGKEVAALVNKNLNAGYHSVNFDASKLQSGLYIYRLQANDFVSIKKMLLMK